MSKGKEGGEKKDGMQEEGGAGSGGRVKGEGRGSLRACINVKKLDERNRV